MTPRPLLRRILDYARDRTGAIGPLGLGLGLHVGGRRPPGAGGNGGGDLTLSRTTIGLLDDGAGNYARHVFDDANYPFSTDDWSGGSVSLSLESGRLRMDGSGPNADGYRVGTYTLAGSLSKAMVFARWTSSTTSTVNSSRWSGPAAHVQSDVAGDFTGLSGDLEFSAADNYSLRRWNDGGVVQEENGVGVSKTKGTFYDAALWADGGATCAMYSHPDDAGHTLDHAVLTEGPLGFIIRRDGSFVPIARLEWWIGMADRYVAFSGLTEGQIAKVLESDETEIAQAAADANGDASVDLLEANWRTAKPHYVRIFESDGTTPVTDLLSPTDEGAEGVWGGDVYEAS